MYQKTSRELAGILSDLSSESALEDFVNDLPETSDLSFSEYYNQLPEVKQYKNKDLIEKSGIERTYFYQILNGTRHPGRDKVILLCMAAGLSLEKTQRALKLSGSASLYPRNRRDAVIIFSINRGLSLADTQDLLLEFGEAGLE